MPTSRLSNRVRILGLAAVIAFASGPRLMLAQDATPKHTHEAASPDATLQQQLHALQAKVAKLEAALKQNHQGASPSESGGDKQMAPMGMGMGMDMGMMRGMSGKKMGMMSGMSEMGGTGMGGMTGKGMTEHPGMKMMGRMKGMGAMQMKTAMPGFPGASHIYHIGAAGFFLDHPQHISLTAAQHQKLNQLQERTLLAQATFDRWVDQAEQEVWVLTSADVPDSSKIEAKIREVAKLGADKRMAYIRAVGEAASVLTVSQRQALVGSLPPNHGATTGEARN